MRGLNGLGHLLMNFALDRFQKSYVGGKPVPNSFSLAMSSLALRLASTRKAGEQTSPKILRFITSL